MEFTTVFPIIVILSIFVGVGLLVQDRRLKRTDEYLGYQDGMNEIFNRIDALGIPTIHINNKLKSLQTWRNFKPDRHVIKRIVDDEVLSQDLIEYAWSWSRELKQIGRLYEELLIGFSDNKGEYSFMLRMMIGRYLVQHDRLVTERLQPTLFIVTWTYTSPKGRNHYENTELYNLHDVSSVLKKIESQNEYKKTAKYQRSLMTAGLRYDILKRDDFKCKICGATQDDGVKLHVDHIKPVSKGGLTEASNLQALCDRCNLGKSDKY